MPLSHFLVAGCVLSIALIGGSHANLPTANDAADADDRSVPRLLSADFSKQRSPVEFHAMDGHAFFSASSAQNHLLQYPGTIMENIVYMDLLEKALDQLNAQMVSDSQIIQLYRFVRDRRSFPNETISGAKTDHGEIIVAPQSRKRARHVGDFPRRIPWLYPDDGCYGRAELVCLWAPQVLPIGPRTLHKIFLFGKPLNASTRFDAHGWHLWQYHVAPIIRSEKYGYLVIDPALSFDKVLDIKEWIRLQTGGKRSIEDAGEKLIGFTITNRFGFNPSFWNACDATESVFDPMNIFNDPYAYLTSKATIDHTINNEWRRMIQLGLNPEKVLGDRPPWKQHNH